MIRKPPPATIIIIVIIITVISLTLLFLFPSVYTAVDAVESSAVDLSPDLNVTNHEPFPFECAPGFGTVHLATYKDKADNRVDIYCTWNEFLGYHDIENRQFMAIYNDITVVGQCPYVYGGNSWKVQTDDNGIINATKWISIARDNPAKSVEYNLTFDSVPYNLTAYRLYEASGPFWALGGIN